MAVDAARRRARAKAAGQAAKERREKILLGVGILILAGLLALEGPKTLKRLNGSSPAPAPVQTLPAASGPTAKVAAPHTVSLNSLSRYKAKDPFVPQVGATSEPPSTVKAVTPPKVRKKQFVQKDPFVQQIETVPPVFVAQSAPATSSGAIGSTAGGQTSAGATGSGSIIVIVASVARQRGRAAAERAATTAFAQGVPDVHVALSSNYPTLRRGFFAVYTGPYPTLDKALAVLEAVRARGYVGAYTRRLAG